MLQIRHGIAVAHYTNQPLKHGKMLPKKINWRIDEAVKENNTNHTLAVSEVAAMCLILLEN
jgi:hypothetical protein